MNDMDLLRHSEHPSLDVKDHDAQNWPLIRQEEYSAVGTAEQYKLWRRSVCLIKCFHELIAGRVKGTAKDAPNILEISEIMGSRGLKMAWLILDQAHAKTDW